MRDDARRDVLVVLAVAAAELAAGLGLALPLSSLARLRRTGA